MRRRSTPGVFPPRESGAPIETRNASGCGGRLRESAVPAVWTMRLGSHCRRGDPFSGLRPRQHGAVSHCPLRTHRGPCTTSSAPMPGWPPAGWMPRHTPASPRPARRDPPNTSARSTSSSPCAMSITRWTTCIPRAPGTTVRAGSSWKPCLAAYPRPRFPPWGARWIFHPGCKKDLNRPRL